MVPELLAERWMASSCAYDPPRPFEHLGRALSIRVESESPRVDFCEAGSLVRASSARLGFGREEVDDEGAFVSRRRTHRREKAVDLSDLLEVALDKEGDLGTLDPRCGSLVEHPPADSSTVGVPLASTGALDVRRSDEIVSLE